MFSYIIILLSTFCCLHVCKSVEINIHRPLEDKKDNLKHISK